MEPLPIDPLLPEIVAALRAAPCAVIEAPPGAGKTTRVPRAIHEAGLAGAGEVVVLEPRRLAARLAARRVAEEMGEKPGQKVGWQVRFEEVASARTRIRYVTEGLLTRRLLAQPTLPGVGAVVLDEVHERHLQADLALALLRRLQRGARPDLKLVAMSATLDAAPVARFLGAASLRSEGRRFEVAIEYLPPEEAARTGVHLEDLVARAVRRLHREGIGGDVLVFLPGAAEIRRAREALASWGAGASVDVLPLHGDLPPDEQDRAVSPGRRPKVILSTNVAETSVTIEGVVAVVDSGLARIATHSPWSGLPTLEVRRISRASAAQRAGRAGRTRPGRALRLYTRHDHDSRPEFDVPEVLREDLSEALLELAGLGAEYARFEWFETPPPAALRAAHELLRRLGAIDAAGAPTETGRLMLRVPGHPRQARLVVEAAARGAPDEGALLAAILGERDLRDRRSLEGGGLPPTGPSDLLEIAQVFEEAARERFAPERLKRMAVNPGAAQAVERARRQLLRVAREIGRRGDTARTPSQAPTTAEPPTRNEQTLLMATLAAYPDRVGRRRAAGSDEVVMVGGGSARLDPASVVRDAALIVAVDAEERRGDRRAAARAPQARVRIASAVTDEMLLDVLPGSLRYEETVAWSPSAERVDTFERLVYEDLVLDERRIAANPEKVAAVLSAEALARGPSAFAPEGALDRLIARIALAANHAPGARLVPPSEADLAAALQDLCRGRSSFAELREADLVGAVLARLGPRARSALDRLAPDRITLPGGRMLRVEYEAGKPPWIESRLQDFFGTTQGPAIAEGKIPLVLHLLAPNRRAVQVTTDLGGFWERHYPAIRRELMRRYPRHAWPEDPRRASPPSPRRR